MLAHLYVIYKALGAVIRAQHTYTNAHTLASEGKLFLFSECQLGDAVRKIHK